MSISSCIASQGGTFTPFEAIYEYIVVHSLTRGTVPFVRLCTNISSYVASQGDRGAVTPGVTLASGRLRGGSRELSGTRHAGEAIGNSLRGARGTRTVGDVKYLLRTPPLRTPEARMT